MFALRALATTLLLSFGSLASAQTCVVGSSSSPITFGSFATPVDNRVTSADCQTACHTIDKSVIGVYPTERRCAGQVG